MQNAKFNPLLLLAVFLGAPLLFGIQNNSFRTAEAETEAVQLPPASRPAPAQQPAQQNAQTTGPRSVTLPMEADGHYWATAKVNTTTSVRFVVDTGASVIALTRQDARRLGINVRGAQQTAHMSTANGMITVPVVMLKRVRVGNVEVANVQAVVIEEGLRESLLGMSFLGQLKTWQTTQAGLVLKQ